VIIVQPGGVYGPGDTSDLAALMHRIRRGRLPFRFFPEAGFNWVHVDDAWMESSWPTTADASARPTSSAASWAPSTT
jgi:nucleoside-diphosphate-sugar epimerase